MALGSTRIRAGRASGVTEGGDVQERYVETPWRGVFSERESRLLQEGCPSPRLWEPVPSLRFLPWLRHFGCKIRVFGTTCRILSWGITG